MRTTPLLLLALALVACKKADKKADPKAQLAPDAAKADPKPQPAPDAARAAPTEATPVTVTFGIEAIGGPDADPPKSRLTLVVTDHGGAATHTPVAEIDAGCANVTGADAAVQGVLGVSRCWWAGGGANFSVAQVGDELVVKRQETDEGMAEPAPWTDVTRLAIPAGATVTFTE